jgi:diacylglycerol diphosphate phosphatase/phosphatidate phosphatase
VQHNQSDSEAQPLEKSPRYRSTFIPGFHSRPPFTLWLRRSWLDISTQLLCLLVAELIYLFATPLMPHYFPLYPSVQISPWGLKHGNPYLDEYISTPVSAALSFAVPFAIMGALGLWHVRDFWESNAAVRFLLFCISAFHSFCTD